jgi:hydrogenase maturation factor
VSEPSEQPREEAHCITCGDEGVVMRVLAHDGTGALCESAEHALARVAVDLVSPVAIGDELLVHAGVAIGHLGMRA